MNTTIASRSRRLSVAILIALLPLLFAGGVAFGQAAAQAPAAEAAADVPAEAAPAEVPAAEATEAAPQGAFFINPLWLVLVIVATAVWLYTTSWVCDDARGVGIDFTIYTTVLLAGGWLGLALSVLVHGAFGFFLLVTVAAAFCTYVVLRDRVVPERHRLLGSHRWAAIVGKVPGLGKLAALPSRARRQGPAFVLKNETGRTTEDVLQEKPTLSEAADVLLEFVLRAGATRSRKVRIQPAGETFVAQFLMDGVLHNVESFEVELGNQIMALAADLAGLAQGGRMRQGTGTLSADLPGMGEAQVGVQIAAAGGKPLLTLALPDWTFDLHAQGLEALGAHESIIKRMRATVTQNRGALLVCGPPESGKTTTLLALAGAIDAFTTDIALLSFARHKVEHVRDWTIPTDRPFGAFYEELLREGPGAILLDSLEEPERAGKALHFACEEGLTLGGLVAIDAPQAVVQLAKLAGSPDPVNRALTCVVPQRLVRKLCTVCREEVEPNPAMLQKLGIAPEDPGHWFRPVGCENCLNSGYLGRTGLFGMLILTDAVKEALTRPKVSAESIREAAGKAAFRTMYQDGIAKVTAGLTTLDEVRRVLKG